jgi:hypothetical protein
MANPTLQHIAHLFQEFDSQLRTLDSLAFQLHIASDHVKITWGEIVTAHELHVAKPS